MGAVHGPTLGESTVSSSNNILATDHTGVAFDPLGNRLWMLHHVRGMRHDAGYQDLALWQPRDVAPHLPLVLMPWVGGLHRIRLRINPQHQIDDIGQRHVARVRSGP